MGQVFLPDNIPQIVIASTTSLTLAATNNGQPTRITVGGQQYTPSSTLSLSTAGTGLNGLDTGTLASNTLYYLYAVVSSGILGLVLSTNSSAPTGFAQYGRCGVIGTNSSTALDSTVGKIGEKITWLTAPGNQSITSNSYVDWTNANIVLSTGRWLVIANISVVVGITSNTGSRQTQVCINDASNNLVQNQEKLIFQSNSVSGSFQHQSVLAFSFVADILIPTTYKIRALETSGAISSVYNNTTQYSEFYAIRQANQFN